jgi:hypothetical protein
VGSHGRSGQVRKNLALTLVRTPDCLARSELLYGQRCMAVEKCWRRLRFVAYFYLQVFNKSILGNLMASSGLEEKLLRSSMLGNTSYIVPYFQ